jgi:hypothetical protein
VLTVPDDLHPNQVAFLGECESSLTVHALAWARTPNAWAALAQSWTSMKAYRDDSTITFKHAKGAQASPSWVFATAPLLGAPFRDNPAEESTLAAWIARAQLSISLALTHDNPKSAKDAAGPAFRDSILECLGGYVEFLKLPGTEPCRVVLAAAHRAERSALLLAAFKDAQQRLQSVFLPTMKLQFCGLGEDPLPLALANLVSAAVLRYVDDPTVGNPIFHAVRPKLIRVPADIVAVKHSRRR